MGWDQEVITGLQIERRLIGDLQDCLASDEKHPFILRLIVPEALGTGLTVRVDSLDPKPSLFEDGGEGLHRTWAVEVCEKGLSLDHVLREK